MRNLNPYPEDSFPVFTTAVDGKSDRISQAALRAAYPTIKPKFQNYDSLFLRNELEHLAVDGIHDTIKDPLLSLYYSKSPVLAQIRKRLQELQHRSIRYTCQYCTLETSKTWDHIVGKEEFPEFAIHPKNLLLACNTCNQIKGERWRTGLNKNLINLYIDQLPDIKYLEVDVFLDDYGEIDFRYMLRYSPGMSYDVYSLILRHFGALHLTDRMREGAIKHLTEFQNAIRPRRNCGESEDSLISSTLESCAADRAVLGLNHWKPTMIEALVNSPVFWDTL
ncbi:HNH endonuclease [Chitinophaga sp. CF418]|uniref:HNH endonuclease n=1 Tax=Chitinophaga sp. CF418 TaxID=1855287 RepID=UPI0009182623|nr:HNH endonuclease [Chitinophaga sp. CF418]SHN24954.1 HNH endonuclease [Chitinophaga sp. CF418]